MNILERMMKEVESFTYETTKQPDFDAFWEKQIALCRTAPLEARREQIECPFPGVRAYRIEFKGIDGVTVRGLYAAHEGEEKRPCMVFYPGYADYSGFVTDYGHWILLGINFLAIDIRDQNAGTGNVATEQGYAVNILTKGIDSPDTYYFRGVYTDAVRAVDFALAQPETDPDRIILMGGSQGGSLTMAVAALRDDIWLAMPDIPSNCCFDLRIIYGQGNFFAIQEYVKRFPEKLEAVSRTLSYFDHVNLADRISCRVFAMVGLKDGVCPAKYYYAAYNRIPARKQITPYPFCAHEVPRNHNYAKLSFVRALLDGKDPK